MDKKMDLLLMIEGPSYIYCQHKLNRLSKALKKNISAGTFSVPGGHKLYMETMEKIEQDYWQLFRKGVKVRSRENGGSLEDRVKGVSSMRTA
jgi:hypothetical protein